MFRQVTIRFRLGLTLARSNCAARLGLGALVFLAIACLFPRETAAAQCAPIPDVTGSVNPGDGSTPLPNMVNAGECVGWALGYGLPWGALSLQPHPTVSSQFCFSTSPTYYFGALPTGSLSCSLNRTTGCWTCGGDMGNAVFYAGYGSIAGHVTSLPSGLGVANASVAANGGAAGSKFILTDAAGAYDFAQQSPVPGNNWGVNVRCDGAGLAGNTVCGHPGSADYQVTTYGADPVGTVVTSSKQSGAELYVKAPDYETPERSTTACPGRSNVGYPINVTTGNMHLDQNDASLPGLAAGGLVFNRSYNSQTSTSGQYGIFGPGWNTNYERRITSVASTPGALKLRLANGVPMYFYQDSPGAATYHATVPSSDKSTIQKVGSLYTLTFREGGTESYQIYADGIARLTAITDVSGNVTTLTRDAAGTLDTITDPGGRALTLVYSGGLLTQLSGPAGVIATYGYDTGGSGLFNQVTYADGSGYTFTYDTGTSGAPLLTVKDLTGRTLETHTYSGGRAVTSEIAGGVERYVLSYAMGTTTVTDALNNLTTYQLGNAGGEAVVTKITGPCASCGAGGSQVQEWTYDPQGHDLTYKDGLGNLTAWTYDTNTGDKLTETDPLNHTTSYSYDSQGRVLTRMAADGGVTTYTYGPSGPLTVKDPINRTTTITYNAAGGKTDTIKSPLNKITTLGYNTFGDLTSVTDPLNNVTTFGYDPMGRRTTVTDALGNTTTTAYDGRGHVTQIENPDATHTDFAYDLGGRRTSVTDPLARHTTYAYDANGRIQTVTDAASGVTTYGYDAMSHLTSLTDARNKTTAFDYNAYGQVIKETRPSGAFETFTYDNAGRLAAKTDRKGVTTTYTYDNIGRLTGKGYSSGSTAVTYGYDAVGRLTSATGGLTWAYDLAGEMTQAVNSGLSLNYLYDAAGNRTTVKQSNTVLITYAYDDDNRLSTITRSAKVFQFGYDDASRRTSLAFPNGVSTSYAYDTLSRLTSLGALEGTTVVADSDYTYDDVGNRLTKTQPGNAETYAYDSLGRLTDATRNGSATEHYTYDAVGNRLSSLTQPTWTYDNDNRLQANGSATFTYDANGNVTKKVEAGATWTYTWDAENRLLQVKKGTAVQTTYTYDALGRRATWKQGSTTITFDYDGGAILRERKGSTVQKIWVHGPGIDEPLASDASGTFAYYHADALGSIIKTTNASGTVTATWLYDAFGGSAAAMPVGYSFTGREWDPTASLHYYRARYYDPKAGRFISEDPIGWAGGVDFYPYVANSPTNLIDPYGFQDAHHRPPAGWQPPRAPDFVSVGCQLIFLQMGFTQVVDGPTLREPGVVGPMTCSCSATINWLNKTKPTVGEATTFASGRSYSGSYFAPFGGALTWSPGNGTATGIGVGVSVGVGVSGSLGGTYGSRIPPTKCSGCLAGPPPPGEVCSRGVCFFPMGSAF